MKRMQQAISVVAQSELDGRMTPLRIRFADAQKTDWVVHVDHIMSRQREQVAGRMIRTYQCQTCFRHQLRRFEIQFDESDWRWYLTKW